MTGEVPVGRAVVDLGRLRADLGSLGVRRGQDLLVHCSLRAIGWVEGGPAALLRAIQDVAGPAATIVVSTQTPWTSPTSRAFRAVTAGLDQSGIDDHMAALPVFDRASTPSYGTGKFAEYVRTNGEAKRSGHPQASFAALGPGAFACTSGHDADCHLGERSPLRWLYDADAAILLLGVGYAVCSAFHLAEYRVNGGAHVPGSDLDDSDFARLGAALDAEWLSEPGRLDEDSAAGPRCGQVGMARSRWVPVRSAVDFAVNWMEKHRSGGGV
jgi:aminoglycoside 3-N-acetyltransferase